MAVPECPSCQCYKVTGPQLEGLYSFTMIDCTTDVNPYKVVEVTILGNQVKYVCAVPNSINAFGMTVEPLCSPVCDCISSGDCPIPPAYCYTVTLESGNNAFIKYITPYSGFDQNIILSFGLSPFISSKTICARENSITKISGDGVISISAPGAPCTENAICTSTCDCITLTNVGFGFDLTYSYLDCETGIRTPEATLAPGDSISFCMLTDGFISTGAPYTINTNGPCETSIECAATTRCTWINSGVSGYAIDENMADLTQIPPAAYDYVLLDFTINGTQYASGQTLSVTDISQVVFGTGLDGNTYMMNISDWMTSVSVALGVGFVFYDNMRVIDYPGIVTSYSIHIQRIGPGGGPGDYYYSSTNGFSITNPTNIYGSYDCVFLPKNTTTTTTSTTSTTSTTTTTTTCCVSSDITIGTQTWSSCNLNVTTYQNGDPIPEVNDPAVWATTTTGAWCYYNNDPSTECLYGKLYNWYAVNDSRGLAPVGYHVPTDAEWTTLTTFLGGEPVAGGPLKEAGTANWFSPNTGATNSTGFTALPGGYMAPNGSGWSTKGQQGWFWSKTAFNSSYSYYRLLGYGDSAASRFSASPKFGFSVRVIKD